MEGGYARLEALPDGAQLLAGSDDPDDYPVDERTHPFLFFLPSGIAPRRRGHRLSWPPVQAMLYSAREFRQEEAASTTVIWPNGKRFAFSIFDDPDSQSEEVSRLVYGFLDELGLRTTKAVWPLAPLRAPNSPGETCANGSFLRHCQELKGRGFEIAFHNATCHSATREETIAALDSFRDFFGEDPVTMANHYNQEAVYWGPARLSSLPRILYQGATLGRTSGRFFGHIPNHPAFWGDVCRARIRYCRNFVFAAVDTLGACPWMPYYDPQRPFVRAWFAASEGSDRRAFLKTLTASAIEKLEEAGGACIMYTHFGHGFADHRTLHPEFVLRMRRLASRAGWFVPAGVLLAYLEQQQGLRTLEAGMRSRLEWRWLGEKVFRGTS